MWIFFVFGRFFRLIYIPIYNPNAELHANSYRVPQKANSHTKEEESRSEMRAKNESQ